MRYDNINKDIIDEILVRNANVDSLGLATGRAGIAFLCFLMGKYSGSVEYFTKGREHLDYLFAHIYEISDLSFVDGLAGAGWTLEFAVQSGWYVNEGHDLLLEEVDDIIYKHITFHRNFPLSLDKGYIGYYFYLYYRLKRNRKEANFYRSLALKECTIWVMGKLYNEMLQGDKAKLTEKDWLHCHILTGKFRSLKIQDNITADMLAETQKMLLKIPRQSLESREIKNWGLLDALRSLLRQTNGYFSLSRFI